MTMQSIARWWRPVPVVYTGLALLILGPLLRPGYVLALDMAWGPRLPAVPLSDNTWMLRQLMNAAAWLIGPMWLQKVILAAVFVLAGWGAHRLVLLNPAVQRVPLSAYAGGVLYVCNPFTYGRFMTGQWLVLGGYALLPWAVAAWWRLRRQPAWPRVWQAVVWSAAVGLVSIHAIGLLAVAVLVLLASSGRPFWRQGRWLIMAASLILALNCIWLIPATLDRADTLHQLGGFGARQMQAFATQGTLAHSVPLSAALLSGFWADAQHRYALPAGLPAVWWPVTILLVGLIGVGLIGLTRQKDRLALALGLSGLLAWWLAMGVGWNGSAGTARWLAQHIPLYAGYREPQKWLALLALAYAYYAAAGSAWLAERWPARPFSRRAVLTAAGILPLLWTPLLLNAGAGQLHSSQYPADWQRTAATLQAQAGDSPVVVLPWHLYLPVSFAGRTVSNPAGSYLPGRIISGDNPELVGLMPAERTQLTQLINNHIVLNRGRDGRMAAQLSAQGVRFIVLLKEADWQRYAWLDKQAGLQRLQDSPHLRLYRVVH